MNEIVSCPDCGSEMQLIELQYNEPLWYCPNCEEEYVERCSCCYDVEERIIRQAKEHIAKAIQIVKNEHEIVAGEGLDISSVKELIVDAFEDEMDEAGMEVWVV